MPVTTYVVVPGILFSPPGVLALAFPRQNKERDSGAGHHAVWLLMIRLHQSEIVPAETATRRQSRNRSFPAPGPADCGGLACASCRAGSAPFWARATVALTSIRFQEGFPLYSGLPLAISKRSNFLPFIFFDKTMSNTHDQLAGGMAPPTVSAPHHGNGNGVGGFFHRLHDAHNADLQEGHGAASAYYSASAPASNAASTGRPASTQDPLVAFEHQLLAHPHPHLHAHPHPAAAATLPDPPRLTARSLTVPTSAFGRNPSPSPSPDARRCMAATDAWTPRLDRRQSWDGQAYRRAMMVKATGLLCGAGNGHSHNHDHGHDSHDEGDHTQCLEHHHHLGHFHPHGTNSSNCSVCSSYEANRGFSECADPTT